jgi:hypothetical protein
LEFERLLLGAVGVEERLGQFQGLLLEVVRNSALVIDVHPVTGIKPSYEAVHKLLRRDDIRSY